MILKTEDSDYPNFTLFDIIGTNEVALSKIFAYVLSSDKDCFFEFIKFLDIKIKNDIKNFKQVNIKVENKRIEGRTDIELEHKNKYRIIIECKVRNGKVTSQRNQYLSAFNDVQGKKILCFLTQERDTNKQIFNDVIIKNISWLDIIELYNNKHFINKQLVNDFLKFATKNYKMRELKEILIQDLSDKIEINRFKNNYVYRRDQTFGTPIYFAPYFNRGCGEIEGISNLSKILGILTLKPNDIDTYRTDLYSFTDDKLKVELWMNGIKTSNDDPNMIYTYYFLDHPLTFKSPLLKDTGNAKGVGKNWIAKMIPPNRCVSFIDFIKHIPELS